MELLIWKKRWSWQKIKQIKNAALTHNCYLILHTDKYLSNFTVSKTGFEY